MATVPIVFVFMCLIMPPSNAIVREAPLPKSLKECYLEVQDRDVSTYVESSFSWACEVELSGQGQDESGSKGPSGREKRSVHQQRFLRALQDELEPELDLTGRDPPAGRRSKRQARTKCVRKEYRSLTDGEREEFHVAINAMKKAMLPDGVSEYDALALLHTGDNVKSAHRGAGFPGWHRLYLLMFEVALQRQNPFVCLPYWDSSLDAEMDDPGASPVWGDGFFGTARGVVTSGPFANWTNLKGGQLVRNVGRDGELMSKDGVRDILSRTRHWYILHHRKTPHRYRLESLHNNVHVFVGGTMDKLDGASADPIFFLHHAFIDQIWERFRTSLRERGRDPESYPYSSRHSSKHRASSLTGIHPAYTQADGYKDFLITSFYSYQPSPVCGEGDGDCGSKHLRCKADVCIPVHYVEPMLKVTATRERSSIDNIPDIVHSVFNEGPTLNTTDMHQDTNSTNVPPPVKQSRPRRSTGQIDGPSSPITDDFAIQNDFCVDGACDSRQWASLPVRVISVRPPRFTGYSSFPFTEGHVNTTHDIYDPAVDPGTYRVVVSPRGNPKTFRRCVTDANVGQVFVTSRGINYDGHYKEVVMVDNRLPVTMSVGYVSVRRPTSDQPTQALLGAHDACGRVCEAHCRDVESGRWLPCGGTVEVDGGVPRGWADTVDQAVLSVFDFDIQGQIPKVIPDSFSVSFFCDYRSRSPFESQP